MNILKLARLLKADRKGFGAMELGLSLPVLMLLGLGTVDASNLIAAKMDFEAAAQRTTDYALAKRPNGSNGAYLRAEAANAAGVSEQDVTVQIFLECNGVKQDNFNTLCPSGEVPTRFVSVEISKPVATEFDWSFFDRVLGVKAFDSAVTVTGDSLVRFQ
ncbi:MAG: hypothetical protein KDD90_02035 [Sphingomonadaceae bacterium]|jgi:Flp pilus assembly protein TadG|nr:hypothetical protein [Sphingomonadaceae bacterium]